jgi:hypothetical protein
LEREKEAQARNKALQIQLRELEDHKKIFYVRYILQVWVIYSDSMSNPKEAYPDNKSSWSDSLKINLQFFPGPLAPSSGPMLRQHVFVPDTNQFKSNESQRTIDAINLRLGPAGKKILDLNNSATIMATTKNHDSLTSTYPARLDPEEYRYARKKLKGALLEHYR